MGPRLAELAHLWTKDAHKYVLMCVSRNTEATLANCAIIDAEMGMVELIEDDDICREVKRRMQMAGVPLIRFEEGERFLNRDEEPG